MEFKGIFLIVATCMLASSSTKSFRRSLSSEYRQGSKCSGGNLIKILNTTNCPNNQCPAKADGNCGDQKTKLEIVRIKASSCIQFTSNSKKYVLKVVSSSKIVFEEKPLGCHKSISSEFLFKESKNNYYVYKHKTSCLKTDCSGTLSLLKSANVSEERECYFRRINWC